MADIMCDVKNCINKKGNLCLARNIVISHNGFCLNNTIVKNSQGQCLTCGNCNFYTYDSKNVIKPVCKLGYLINFCENNKCWTEKNS